MVARKKKTLPLRDVDAVLKAMLVLSRTVDHVLENCAVEGCGQREVLVVQGPNPASVGGSGGSQTATQVARFLGVSKPAVSQIINTMVRARLVVRRPAKEDRREVGLELTKKGARRLPGDSPAAAALRQRHAPPTHGTRCGTMGRNLPRNERRARESRHQLQAPLPPVRRSRRWELASSRAGTLTVPF